MVKQIKKSGTKKNKKVRVIHAPSRKLKKLQKEFSDWFLKIKKVSVCLFELYILKVKIRHIYILVKKDFVF